MTWLSQERNDAVSSSPSAIPSRRSRHSWTAKNVGARRVDTRKASNPEWKPSQTAHLEEPERRPETWSRWCEVPSGHCFLD